ARQERMETGEYGPVLKDLVKQGARPAPRRDPNNPDGQPSDGQPNYASDQPGDGSAPQPPGGGGGRMGRGGRGGAGGGAFAGGGAGFQGAGGAGAGSKTEPRRWSSKADGKETVNLAAVKQISPCLLWLGKVDSDDREDLNKRAEALD